MSLALVLVLCAGLTGDVKMLSVEEARENAGMFEWLEEKGFSPLTQSAEYYKAGKEKI